MLGSPTARSDTPSGASVSITLDDAANPTLVFEARENGSAWIARARLEDAERLLADFENGLASSMVVGHETAQVRPEDEDVTVPVGPFALIGSSADWRAVLEREKADPRSSDELPAAAPTPFAGDRKPFPVLETD